MRLKVLSLLVFFLSSSAVVVMSPSIHVKGASKVVVQEITGAAQGDALLLYLEKEFEDRFENGGLILEPGTGVCMVWPIFEPMAVTNCHRSAGLPEAPRPFANASNIPLHLVKRTFLI